MDTMREDYDFSEARANPYAKRLKKRVTIRLDEVTITYFKQLAKESGIPYQTLINLYLRDCAASNRRLRMSWKPPKSAKVAP
jgi:predicted DNA binding CopG/RHH family protein